MLQIFTLEKTHCNISLPGHFMAQQKPLNHHLHFHEYNTVKTLNDI